VVDREGVVQAIGDRLRTMADLCGLQPRDRSAESPKAPESFLEKTNCILCLCCLSVCPVSSFLPLMFLLSDMMGVAEGPDREKARRAFEQMGLSECIDCRKCQDVCPRKIRIHEEVIEPTKSVLGL
jgi:succinate dehydrogenase/fumarate reductase-like Fe-S protein